MRNSHVTNCLTQQACLYQALSVYFSVHAVVHCPTGIGPTGIVLFCLLCYDHLDYNKKVDIFAVLHQMRSDRARLVENQKQFKLCLELLDEVLFGTNNTILAPKLAEKLQDLIAECDDHMRRINALPNVLDTSDSALEENVPYNRDHNILPPMSHRAFIQVSDIMIIKTLL